MYNTLSIYGSHDASATFIDSDGELCVLEYERFVKKRYAAFSRKFEMEEDFRKGLGTSDFHRRGFLSYIKNKLNREIELIVYNELSEEDLILLNEFFPNCSYKKKEHHMAHACCAYYQSGLEEALIVSIDGGGMDYDGIITTKVYLAKGNKIKAIYKSDKNLGNAYGGIGVLLSEIKKGWDADHYSLSHAGKTMGICAYGKERKEWFPQMREFYASGGHNYNTLKSCLEEESGKDLNEDSLEGQVSYDLAATSQYVFEEECVRIMKPLVQKYKRNVVFTGGCALNVLFNQSLKIALGEIGLDLYVPPNPNDCGLSLGQMLSEHPKQIDEIVYNGFDLLDRRQLPSYVKDRGARPTNTKEIVDLLKQGKILGLVYGKSEVGPRALGNRSIICDPSFLDMKDVLNKKVKFREWFRPFAPVCLLERSPEFFVNPFESNYMSYAPLVKEEFRNKLPSITHEDGTARLQTVTKEQHTLFWWILKELENRNEIPVILNTSFNIKGLPILTTIEDALNCLDNTEMDYVIIEGYLFGRKK